MATINELAAVSLFEHLREDQLQWLSEHSEDVTAEPGDYLFREGDPADYFYVVLDGEVQITKNAANGEIVLNTHKPGSFSGEVPLLSGTPYVASARAVVHSKLIRLDSQSFREMFAICPVVVGKLFGQLQWRIQTTESLARQREKMSALGVLAAGLAHELNNPAAAARRAASQIRDTFEQVQPLLVEVSRQLETDQFDALMVMKQEAAEVLRSPSQLDALTQSDREDEIGSWLDDQEIEDGWDLAPTLVSAGFVVDKLESLLDVVGADALPAALKWLSASLGASSLVNEVEQSTKRISELVKAVKSYSYMDQAPLQEIDVHDGIEDTLTIMGHKLRERRVNIVRNYDRSISRITAYGSELNQVWTNIIDNAIDAMRDGGQITIRTWGDNEDVWVELADTGPGIPDDIQSRIFEPFYTTKGVGKGTGLGLDIAHRVVVDRHHGEIKLLSKPGETRFQIRLPINDPLFKKENGKEE